MGSIWYRLASNGALRLQRVERFCTRRPPGACACVAELPSHERSHQSFQSDRNFGVHCHHKIMSKAHYLVLRSHNGWLRASLVRGRDLDRIRFVRCFQSCIDLDHRRALRVDHRGTELAVRDLPLGSNGVQSKNGDHSPTVRACDQSSHAASAVTHHNGSSMARASTREAIASPPATGSTPEGVA